MTGKAMVIADQQVCRAGMAQRNLLRGSRGVRRTSGHLVLVAGWGGMTIETLCLSQGLLNLSRHPNHMEGC